MAEPHDGPEKKTSTEKSKSRRGYESFEAMSPNGESWEILISHRRMDQVARDGLGKARELAFIVKQELLSPVAIYRGVRDLERDVVENDWWCYVLQPIFAYDYKTDERVTAWDNEVILAYVTDEQVLYNWYWTECDPVTKNLPVDHEERFKEKVF